MTDSKNAHVNGKETGDRQRTQVTCWGVLPGFPAIRRMFFVFDIRILTLRQRCLWTVGGWLSQPREDWLARFWDHHAPTLGYASDYTFHHAAESNYNVLALLETLSNIPFWRWRHAEARLWVPTKPCFSGKSKSRHWGTDECTPGQRSAIHPLDSVLDTLAQIKKCQQLSETCSWKGLSSLFSCRGHIPCTRLVLTIIVSYLWDGPTYTPC